MIGSIYLSFIVFLDILFSRKFPFVSFNLLCCAFYSGLPSHLYSPPLAIMAFCYLQ